MKVPLEEGELKAVQGAAGYLRFIDKTGRHEIEPAVLLREAAIRFLGELPEVPDERAQAARERLGSFLPVPSARTASSSGVPAAAESAAPLSAAQQEQVQIGLSGGTAMMSADDLQAILRGGRPPEPETANEAPVFKEPPPRPAKVAEPRIESAPKRAEVKAPSQPKLSAAPRPVAPRPKRVEVAPELEAKEPEPVRADPAPRRTQSSRDLPSVANKRQPGPREASLARGASAKPEKKRAPSFDVDERDERDEDDEDDSLEPSSPELEAKPPPGIPPWAIWAMCGVVLVSLVVAAILGREQLSAKLHPKPPAANAQPVAAPPKPAVAEPAPTRTFAPAPPPNDGTSAELHIDLHGKRRGGPDKSDAENIDRLLAEKYGRPTVLAADDAVPQRPDFEAMKLLEKANEGLPPDKRYDSAIAAAVADARVIFPVPPELVKAIIRQESNFDPYAQSKVGAIGLMQLMPFNARRVGLKSPDELWEADKNILAGVRLVAVLLRYYKGDVMSALVAYNAQPRKLFSPLPQNGETPAYVAGVLRYWEGFLGRPLRELPQPGAQTASAAPGR